MGSPSLKNIAQTNLRDTIRIALGHTPDHRAMIVYDAQSELSIFLAEAYRAVLPDAVALDFDRSSPEAIWEAINTLSEGVWFCVNIGSSLVWGPIPIKS